MASNGTDRNSRTAIIVALISCFSAISVAFIYNWDKIFPKTANVKRNTKVLNLPPNGKIVESNLDNTNVCTDLRLAKNFVCEKYILTGKSGQKVKIEMSSDEFDPFLILQKPNGDRLKVNGDISPQNWDAKIVVDLTEDGEYTIIARTTSVGESGNYSIRTVVQ